jgi:hypothetical protein
MARQSRREPEAVRGWKKGAAAAGHCRVWPAATNAEPPRQARTTLHERAVFEQYEHCPSKADNG